MESSQSPSSSQSQPRLRDSEMEVHAPVADDVSNIWDWGDLLDFTADEGLGISWDSGQVNQTPEESPDPGRVRKRDPRLTCSNFLAGRVPCACPEMDEKLMELEEEEAGHGKKRARTVRAPSGSGARCQVPSCGADIGELKGYHRRHRVCLRCAASSTVIINGEKKRYCQQCGKFHVLSDFDEGKRSCRRKLEQHNKLRRKPANSRGGTRKKSQGDIQSEAVINCDGEAGEDRLQFSSQIVEKESLLEADGGQISNLCTALDSKDAHSDDIASGEIDRQKYNSKNSLSPSYCDNKSAYSSICPTGRISFKLYDWNPAEFPRRLRHQIFQWLSSMPVELEGYIRPGCTILTVFIAMPQFMWKKMLEDPIAYVHDFVVSPGRMLFGRGNLLVHLNNMVFHVVNNGTSVIKAKVEVQAPRLHYVHPSCFEAGKPMEFVACGSNLLQPKLRFLISFSGKYLAYDYHPELSHFQSERGTECSFDHQLCRIHVPHTEANNFGPAFIEVENEAGLSNFVPVLIGDKETCSEITIIEQRIYESLYSERSQIYSLPDSCEVSSLIQTSCSEVISDIGWLLKRPGSESFQQIMTVSKIQRFNCLLNFLISIRSTAILEKILQNLEIIINNMNSGNGYKGGSDADLRLLQKYMDYAREILQQKLDETGGLTMHSKNSIPKEEFVSQCCFSNDVHSVPFSSQDMEIMVNGNLEEMEGSTYDKRIERLPFLNKEGALKASMIKEWPKQASGCSSSGVVLNRRPAGLFLIFRPSVYILSAAALCLGICAVLFHPQKVNELAVTIRKCLSGKL